MSDHLTPIIQALREGKGPAIPSVCSAHPDVIAAGLRQAAAHGMPALIEATSNQVNQFGGYTGMTPVDFVGFVQSIAQKHRLEDIPLILGGDHLGPQAWRDQPAGKAMAQAADMIRAYIEAGFTKIHLDCSEGCAGEEAQVGDELAASRAARLAAVAEAAAHDPQAVTYIIGTEVPPPGGARHDGEGIAPTPPENAAATLKAHHSAFEAEGIAQAWDRIRGLVVQPGLEFAPASIHAFDMRQSDRLSPVLGDNTRLCFEAHSTDYQSAPVYADLSKRNFGILKVGPALTFAWREALYALSHIRQWLDGSPHISMRMEELMTENPGYWKGHYHGGNTRLLRHFGYADRIRYYWPGVEAGVQELCDAIDRAKPPEPLIGQYLPQATLDRAAGIAGSGLSRAILQAHVEEALAPYYPVTTC